MSTPIVYGIACLVMIVVLIIVWKLAWMLAVRISDSMESKRREALLDKYKDVEVVDKISQNMFWLGQTPEQLVDSIGKPIHVDRKVYKKKTKEVWKYAPASKSKYGLRIILEDGEVTGWEEKS